jgi:peptidoglycan/LPS O-acetylase OafA/YrhL
MPVRHLFSGPRLGDFRGRDNNFNLIRFLAAALVIWTHAFGLLDRTSFEPVFRTFHLGAGDLGVDIFFVLSGFLVSIRGCGFR